MHCLYTACSSRQYNNIIKCVCKIIHNIIVFYFLRSRSFSLLDPKTRLMTFPSDGFIRYFFFSFYSSSHRRFVSSSFPAGGCEFVTVRVETTIPQEIAAAGRRRRRFVDCECRTRELIAKRVWYRYAVCPPTARRGNDLRRLSRVYVIVGLPHQPRSNSPGNRAYDALRMHRGVQLQGVIIESIDHKLRFPMMSSL